jgi:hypothetical protein
MRFLGEWAQFNVASFRNTLYISKDVYLENISDHGSDPDRFLTMNSTTGQITYRTGAEVLSDIGAGTSVLAFDGSTANGVLTYKDADEMTVESNLTFDGSALGLTGVMDISPANDAGAAALTIDNDDIDQIALDINADNTTANIIDIGAGALTTGNAIFINMDESTTGRGFYMDVDDALTASKSQSLAEIDYLKAGASGSVSTVNMYGFMASIRDSATNHVNSNVNLSAFNGIVDFANAQGNTVGKGLGLTVTDAAVNYGITLTVEDGSENADILMYSSIDTTDYCSIRTDEHGVTTLKTWDNADVRADFICDLDGAMKWYKTGNASDYLQLDIGAHGDATFTTVDAAAGAANMTFDIDGLFKTTAIGVEIENASDSDAVALLIDNDDVDQHALKLEAANTTQTALAVAVPDLTTGHAINVNADSLTTGAALRLDVDDSLTTNSEKSLLIIDYDKAGVTAASQASATRGLDINLADAATNHASGMVSMTGVQIDIDSANTQGSIKKSGIVMNVAADGVGDTAVTGTTGVVGLDITCMDGGSDIILKSHAEQRDHCTIATTTDGATTITTTHHGGESANFEIAADGDITLDSAGQIKLEPVGGSNILLDGTVAVDGGSVTGITTLGVDSVSLTAVQTSGESFVDNDTSIMTSAAIDDKINTKYAYTYMTWSASAVPTRDGSNNPEWMLPNINKGIYEEDWNADSNVTATSTGTTTYTLNRYHAVNSLIVPQAGVLVGFHAIGRNHTTDATFKAGLFHAANGSGSTGIDYGHTAATHEFTLRCVATAAETDASGGTDGTASHSFKGPCKLISNTADLTLAAGDALLPAIMGNDASSSDEIMVTMTIILKIPLTT